MEVNVKEFLLYTILRITILQQWTSGDDRNVPRNNTFHLQGNQTTDDIICFESTYEQDGVTNNSINCFPQNITQNITSNKTQSDGPVFVQDIYRASLLETSEINSMVLQVEAKEQNTTFLNYSLVGQNCDDFYIDPQNGVIFLAKPLEFNTINKYILAAKATDIKGNSSTVPVLVDIKDVDTMNPHFMYPLYTASIFENQSILFTHPEEIKAMDGDIGLNEKVNYNISNVHPVEFSTSVFMNTFNGVISVIMELDRESVSLITVYIKATQQNNHLKSTDSVVLITILDENDNPPQFSQPVYETSVPEDLPKGSEVLLLTVSDKDEEALSSGYFITNDTMFGIDKQGLMYLNDGAMDRELTAQVFVKVWAIDADSDGLNSSALVIITVTDVNDNNPEFQNQSLLFTVPEGNYSTPLLLGEVNVFDKDAGLNGQTTVTSENKDIFVVQNGTILINGSLDRETMDRYIIFLIASDNGMPPRKSFADLVIDVQDVNDNAPTFTQSAYSVHLALSAMKTGDPVLVVSATDLDIGNNSQISYRFAKPHNGFTINEQTGVISLTSNIQAVSMESIISLIVIAADHGVPTLSSNATISVAIEKGSPEFLNSSYSFNIFEGMPPGTEVGTVQASAGPGLPVTYFLETYTETFSITDKGKILTCITLDREDQDSYSVMVKAVHSGEAPSTGAVVVTVAVVDINDNVPLFSPVIHTNITCPENQDFLDLGIMRATDKDIGNNGAVTYLLENDFDGIFHIDNYTGQLTNIKQLDRETMDSYELIVIARDAGSPPLSSAMMIHISVEDVDDNPPIFERSLYEITVKENEPPHVILNVSATDKDTGDNSLIMYSFTKVSHLFHVGEISGSLSNLQLLDFEKSTQHVMTVTAYSPRDPTYQSNATVIVHVEDVNEHGPTVENKTYNTVIWDNSCTAGSTLLDINATQGNNSVDEGIHYSISGDSNGLFAISNASGHIFLTKDLPPPQSPLHYTFTVICRDSGIPPLSTSIPVFIALSPSNVSYPVFSSDYYCPEALNDWTPPSTIVTQIKAFYLPAPLVYSITTESDKDYFMMDTLTGIIRTKKALIVTDFPRNITVKATDSQKSWIYSQSIVHLTVIHGNQWAPVFPNSLVKVSVKEDQKVPTLTVQVQATDADTDRNGVIQYSILNNDFRYFNINVDNGQIFALFSFDFENGPREFKIFILAEDHGKPQRKQGYCTVDVLVIDINDCQPIFVPMTNMSIEENTPVGTFVGQVRATDQDSGDNAFILYSLYDEDGLFKIDEILGNILVKESPDYESKQNSVLNITATNNKTAPFYQTSTLLTVYILDENDNSPQFNQKQYFAELDVNSPVGTLVTTVNASDRDQGDHGIIEYFLSPDNYFLIENVRDGRIITAGKLNPGEIIITVLAKDKGSPSLNSNVSIILNVVQKEDSFPTFDKNELSTDLKKNKTKGYPVYIFSAKDKSGNNVTYRLVAGNEGGQFYLDENTGELWTTKRFNYDGQPFYDIIVEAYTAEELEGPLPKNMARLQINLADIDKGPVFEKQIYYATVQNTLPRGFPIINVTAKDASLGRTERLVYSIVNQSEEEFTIDKYTGQIKMNSVAGKKGMVPIEVQAKDPDGLFAQTIVLITLESPTLSRDDVEIKINQTIDEVQLHAEKIKRVLEKLLQQKINIVELVSKNNDTIIRLQAAEIKGNKELFRKLKEDMPIVQKKMDEIFHKPVDVTVNVAPQTFTLDQGLIVGIVVAVFTLCGLFTFFAYKRCKSSGNTTDEEKLSAHMEEDVDNGTQNTMAVENNRGEPTPAKINVEPQAEYTVIETEDHQSTANESEAPEIIPAMIAAETEVTGTVIDAEDQQTTGTTSDVLVPESISAESDITFIVIETEDQCTNESDVLIPESISAESDITVTVIETEDQCTNESGALLPEIIPAMIAAETCVEYNIIEAEDHQTTAATSDVLVPESISAESDITFTVMETEDQTTIESADEPTDHKDISMEGKGQQETTMVQETTVEYVETWESYESDEDSAIE